MDQPSIHRPAESSRRVRYSPGVPSPEGITRHAVGEFGQTHVVFVTRFVDQRLSSLDAFDIARLDEAPARYDEFELD
jgi:hypothetical protein